MSAENPKIFEQGPLAETIQIMNANALSLFNNGSFFDLEFGDGEQSVKINLFGRDSSAIDVRRIVEVCDEEGNFTNECIILVDHTVEKITTSISDLGGFSSVSFDARTSYEVEDEPTEVDAEVIAINLQDFMDTLEFVAQGVASTAYFAGRSDQIEDLFGSNKQRFVPARFLRQILERADRLEYGMLIDFSQDNPDSVVEALRSMRGILKETDHKKPDLKPAKTKLDLNLPEGSIGRVTKLVWVDGENSEEGECK